MKQKRDAGFSLVEVLIAIVVLGMLVVPTCTSLLMSVRLNNRTEEILAQKLAVSSAVEILMAEGIHRACEGEDDYYDVYEGEDPNGQPTLVDRFPEVTVRTEAVILTEGGEPQPYYQVTVATNDGRITVTTYIRYEDPPVEDPDQTGGESQ